MYGFPTQLYPVPQGLFRDQSAGFGASINNNIFYSIRDGNWSDPMMWEVVGDKILGRTPTQYDDVYVRHTVNLDSAEQATHNCNNLFVSGTLIFTFYQTTLNVYGDIKCTGLIDFSFGGYSICALNFYGRLINSNLDDNHFLAGNNWVRYQYVGEWMEILPVTYYKLSCSGFQYITKDLIVLNNFMFGQFDMRNNYSFFGNIQIDNARHLYKYNGGTIIIAGITSTSGGSIFTFDGNPDIEFRGSEVMLLGTNSNFGTGVIKFNTNNQTMSQMSPIFNTNLIIEDIVFTIGNGSIQLGSGANFNGISGASQLVIASGGTLIFNWDAPYPMSTGVFNHMANAGSAIGYGMTTNYTIPLTTFQGLQLINGATKSLQSGSVVNGNLVATITGVAILGNVTLIGLVNINGANFTLNGYTAELRGGFTSGSRPPTTISAGTILFTTNSQNIYSNVINANILISGAITITTVYGGENISITLKGTLNGDNSSSKLVNTPGGTFNYQNAQQPMLTGILDCSTNANIFKYNMAGNQDVTGTTYRTLEFGGSGVKKLMGNVVVNVSAGGSWSITGTATIDYNGFTITTI